MDLLGAAANKRTLTPKTAIVHPGTNTGRTMAHPYIEATYPLPGPQHAYLHQQPISDQYLLLFASKYSSPVHKLQFASE